MNRRLKDRYAARCRLWILGPAIAVGCACTAWAQPVSEPAQSLHLMTEWRPIQRAIDQLGTAESQTLLHKKERFDALSSEVKTQMRQTHQQLCTQPNAAQLYDVMVNYRNWLATLPAATRAELLDAPPEKRIEMIKQIKNQETQEWIARKENLGLQPKDARYIPQFIAAYVVQHWDQLVSGTDSPPLNGWTQKGGRNSKRQLMRLWFSAVRSQQPLPPISKKEARRLTSHLSETAKTVWDETEPDDRMQLVRKWAQISFRQYRGELMPPEEIENFYLRLSPEQKDQLNQLPPEDMQKQLRQLYLLTTTDDDRRIHDGPPDGDFPRRHAPRNRGAASGMPHRGPDRGPGSGPDRGPDRGPDGGLDRGPNRGRERGRGRGPEGPERGRERGIQQGREPEPDPQRPVDRRLPQSTKPDESTLSASA